MISYFSSILVKIFMIGLLFIMISMIMEASFTDVNGSLNSYKSIKNIQIQQDFKISNYEKELTQNRVKF